MVHSLWKLNIVVVSTVHWKTSLWKLNMSQWRLHKSVYDIYIYNIPTIFMQLFSLNVLGRSVAISMARISTAFPSSLLAFTKSPLHTMAHALPSLVGLVGKEERERE